MNTIARARVKEALVPVMMHVFTRVLNMCHRYSEPHNEMGAGEAIDLFEECCAEAARLARNENGL